MASLTNTKIKDTYDGLLKTTDNDALGGTYKLITDGLGNSSGVYLGTGGNVGIGQSSPTTYKLDVNGTFRAVSTAYFESGINAASYIYHSGDTNTFFGFPANDTFTVTTNNAERMRIDSGGNVQIGSGTRYGKFDILNVGGSGTNFIVDAGSNGDNYFTSGTSGIQVFRSGSTERMRIDSSGVVQVKNIDSPTFQLFNTDTSLTTNQVIGDIDFYQSDPSGGNVGVVSKIRSINSSSFQGEAELAFHTGTTTSLTERMRIDSSGNVGIGTTDPQKLLHIAASGASSVIRIQRTNTNTTGAFGALQWCASDNHSVASIVAYGDGNDEGAHLVFRNTSAASSGDPYGMIERMRITSSGRIHFYNLLGSSATQSDVRYDTTSKEIFYNTSSERYKTEIVDLENTLDKVNSLRAVRYKDIETEQETTGLIAEEVIEIIPEVVFKKEIEGFDEPQPEGINYSDFAPFLIKAIQELKAEIETLKSQINS